MFDENMDGSISAEEFSAGLAAVSKQGGGGSGLSEPQIRMLLHHMDVDGDGKITYSEFLQAFETAGAAP